MKKAAILQSNYIPWKGYFDIIHDVDLCIFYDCVQYTRQDWRNRNQVFLSGKKAWLSVPVRHPHLGEPIHSVLIDNRLPWQSRHFEILRQNYSQAPCFKEIAALISPFLAPAGRAQRFERLSEYNQAFIKTLCAYLGVSTEFVDSAPLHLQGHGTERVLDALVKVGASAYLSGPSAASYLDPGKFSAAGISLTYKDYSGYPPYPQGGNPEFDGHVSVLDLLFQKGRLAPDFIWGWR